jgi:ATP-dependent DNA ligase
MPVSCSVIGRVTTTKIGFDVDLSGWLNVQGDCKLGLEGIVSKRLDAPYKSGPSKIWLKIKNPKAPAATRAVNRTF